MLKLYNDDCLTILKNIPNESIDLCVTDCPYHIVGGGCSNGEYNKNKNPGEIFNRKVEYEYRINDKGRKVKYLKGTNHIATGGILNDCEATTYARQGKLFKHNDIKFSDWLPEIYRIMKNGTHIYIYINARNLKELQQEAEKVGFIFQNILIWVKNNSTPNKYYLNNYEMILMLRKGKAKNINNMGTKNVFMIDNILGGKKTHPTEKPVELNKILIENSSNINDTVIDCFMGSGSTGIACKELERSFIGIEIDEKYFKTAEERINKSEKEETNNISDNENDNQVFSNQVTFDSYM